ncbi:MAG: MtrAB system response regulator MtrA [Dermabacter sp.]|nr:MtrAB system response regulator MtrA [Dermabacter sp.]
MSEPTFRLEDTRPSVLVVDDDQASADMTAVVLRGRGFDVMTVPDGASALEAAARRDVDLVILEVALAGMDGIQVCRTLRERSEVPIMFLTWRHDTADVVESLEAGADDYVTKPWEPDELVARARARVRRSRSREPESIAVGDLVIDVQARRVRRGTEAIALTPLEFSLLLHLARAPWQAFSRDDLLRDVWGYRQSADSRVVKVNIQRLRAKIEPDPAAPRIILTVRGVGYRAAG